MSLPVATRMIRSIRVSLPTLQCRWRPPGESRARCLARPRSLRRTPTHPRESLRNFVGDIVRKRKREALLLHQHGIAARAVGRAGRVRISSRGWPKRRFEGVDSRVVSVTSNGVLDVSAGGARARRPGQSVSVWLGECSIGTREVVCNGPSREPIPAPSMGLYGEQSPLRERAA